MKRTILLMILITLIFSLNKVNADFNFWVESTEVFTIGSPATFMVYVENLEPGVDNYVISYDVNYEYPAGNDLSHIIDVRLQTNKIENVQTNQIKDTQGTVTILAQVYPPGGTIIFTARSDGGVERSDLIQVSGGPSGGIPKTLPEFSILGFLQLIFLAVLVVSYSFHFG
jgi:hypothetical protein